LKNTTSVKKPPEPLSETATVLLLHRLLAMNSGRGLGDRIL